MSRRQEPIIAPVTQVKPFPAVAFALLLGGVLVVVALAFVLWPRGQPVIAVQPTGQVDAGAPTSPPPTATSVPVTATPNYPDITPHLAIIIAHEEAGRWSEAAAAAEAALGISGLRDEDRKTLTYHGVFSGLKDLYTQPFRPLDKEQHQRMVDTYLALKERARGANVDIDTPLQVASSAFASSQFQLARVGLGEALKDGSFQPETDRDITKFFVSTLFGLGKWYTTASHDDPLYQEGLCWLSASHRIAVKFQTGQGDAAMLLSQLVSEDETKWPKPCVTPLLDLH